ncbi:hypothetical protein M8J77_006270 [Diaphorina citri]|nr:hypothetical protein M8J77_006270 [Diaphorina citri]
MKMMTGVPSNFVTDNDQGGNSVNNIDSKNSRTEFCKERKTNVKKRYLNSFNTFLACVPIVMEFFLIDHALHPCPTPIRVVPPTQQLHVQDRWSDVKHMPEVQHRVPRRETSILVSSSTHQPGRHHILDGPNGGGTLP